MLNAQSKPKNRVNFLLVDKRLQIKYSRWLSICRNGSWYGTQPTEQKRFPCRSKGGSFSITCSWWLHSLNILKEATYLAISLPCYLTRSTSIQSHLIWPGKCLPRTCFTISITLLLVWIQISLVSCSLSHLTSPYRFSSFPEPTASDGLFKKYRAEMSSAYVVLLSSKSTDVLTGPARL